MLDGQGNPITTAYLSFQLWNCSGQVAEVIGESRSAGDSEPD